MISGPDLHCVSAKRKSHEGGLPRFQPGASWEVRPGVYQGCVPGEVLAVAGKPFGEMLSVAGNLYTDIRDARTKRESLPAAVLESKKKKLRETDPWDG